MNRVKGLRVPESATPEVRELADFALDRVVDCVKEAVPSHAAPSVLKGAALIFQLICEKDESGSGFSLQDFVRLAAQGEQEEKARTLPPQPRVPPPDAEEATFTPVDPPPPTREEENAARYRMTREHAERSAPPPPPPRPEPRPYAEVFKDQEKRAADWESFPPGWNRVR